MNRLFRSWKCRAFTLVEMMFVSAIGLMVAGMVLYLLFFVSHADAMLGPQLYAQVGTEQAIQQMCDALRNSRQSSPVLYKNGVPGVTSGADRIDFQQVNQPAVSSFRFLPSNDSATGQLVYYPNTNSNAGKQTINHTLASLSFSQVTLPNGAGTLYQIDASYIYRKYKGYNAGAADQLNGTFSTQVFPRTPPAN